MREERRKPRGRLFEKLVYLTQEIFKDVDREKLGTLLGKLLQKRNFLRKQAILSLLEFLDNIDEALEAEDSEVKKQKLLYESFKTMQKMIEEKSEKVRSETGVMARDPKTDEILSIVLKLCHGSPTHYKNMEKTVLGHSKELKKADISSIKETLSGAMARAEKLIRKLSKDTKPLTEQISDIEKPQKELFEQVRDGSLEAISEYRKLNPEWKNQIEVLNTEIGKIETEFKEKRGAILKETSKLLKEKLDRLDKR